MIESERHVANLSSGRKRPSAVALSEIAVNDVRPTTPTEHEPVAGPSSDRSCILASNSPLTPNESTRESSLSPTSDISTPAKRKGGTRAVPIPSPLKHTVARLSPRLSRRSSSRRQGINDEIEGEPPKKSARTSKGKEKEKEVDEEPETTDMMGEEEETAVEDLVADPEDEEMTPVPESEVQLADEDVVPIVEPEAGDGDADVIDVDNEVDAEEDDGEEEYVDESYKVGELGEFPCITSRRSGYQADFMQYGQKVCVLCTRLPVQFLYSPTNKLQYTDTRYSPERYQTRPQAQKISRKPSGTPRPNQQSRQVSPNTNSTSSISSISKIHLAGSRIPSYVHWVPTGLKTLCISHVKRKGNQRLLKQEWSNLFERLIGEFTSSRI